MLAWIDQAGRACLEIRGFTPAELVELGRLSATARSRQLIVLPSELVQAGADLHALQPIAGRIEVEDEAVRFIPRFPFVDGAGYSVFMEEDAGRSHLTIERPSRAVRPTTRVVGIHPDVDELPVNVLKLYVWFSAPMSEWWATRSVQVLRADNGDPIEDVFVRMEPELWDPERQRLTLLLDPGRIKRGLVPNEEAGYPLIEGVPIVLRINQVFRDAAGQPLASGAERRYAIGPLLRAHVDPRAWHIEAPPAGSTDPLVVRFDRPLDYALLEHSLWVIDAHGGPVDGQGSTGHREESWSFVPQWPWTADRYALTIDPRLEDLAGNSLVRVFDRDLDRAEDTPASDQPFALAFHC